VPNLLVLDTNVVLDLFVFGDARALPLKERLRAGQAGWIATAAMRDELQRVLGYAAIAARLQSGSVTAGVILQQFDCHSVLVDAPERAPLLCEDSEDQMFVDLAVQRRCLLLSKDAAVLAMKKRLALLGVTVAAAMPAP
jgi:predicted nucleic acid-binding protein